jgi:hypothetical protein
MKKSHHFSSPILPLSQRCMLTPVLGNLFLARLGRETMDKTIKLESLDTSFVKLGALIRHLQQQGFVGRVKVVLDQYEADVFLYGSEEPSVWESDHSTGRNAQGKEAMERLLVRAQEAGGIITIHQKATEADEAAQLSTVKTATANTPAEITKKESSSGAHDQGDTSQPAFEEVDWEALLGASGELIRAIEKTVQDTGEDFAARFQSALIEIADDYSFLEPTTGGFHYSDAKVQLRDRPTATIYVTSLTEALRRVVNKVASAKDGKRFREQLVVELAAVAHQKENTFAEFTSQLDRIAGTKVV